MHVPHHSLHYMQYLQTLKGKLVASLTVRDFVANMSGMFVPVFLYSFGYSFTFIAVFYVIYYAFGWFLFDLAAYIIAKYGIYHSLFLSYISMALGSGLLSFAGDSVLFVFLAFIPLALSEKCFWPARHIDIARLFAEGKTMKRTASILQTLNMFVAAIAPLFGGLLAAQYGPQAALFAAFVITLFAIALLWQEYAREQGEPVTSTFSMKYKRPMLGNGAMNLQMIVSALIWPLFIFLILDSFSSIGLIFSISFGLGMLLTYASGNWFNSFPYFRVGAVFRIISFPFRAIAGSFGIIFLADITGAAGNGLMNTRYTSRFYNSAKHSGDIDSFIFSVERAGELGKLAIWSFLLVLLLTGVPIKTAIISCFIIAALVIPFVHLIGPSSEE